MAFEMAVPSTDMYSSRIEFSKTPAARNLSKMKKPAALVSIVWYALVRVGYLMSLTVSAELVMRDVCRPDLMEWEMQ